jgi:hypothetical protein
MLSKANPQIYKFYTKSAKSSIIELFALFVHKYLHKNNCAYIKS